MADKILLRGDTKANWESVNPILADREIVIEKDTLRIKIGNGVDAYNSLQYANETAAKYKVYSALLSFDSSSNAFTVIVLNNDVGEIIWSRTGGNIQGSSAGLFTQNKSFAVIGGINGYSNACVFASESLFGITTTSHDGTTNSLPSFSKMSIEIRVYD